jgi:hypothetical protein
MDTAIPADAQCLNCRYFLRELTCNRCPECGQPFDPAIPTTMWLGRRSGREQSVLLRPFGKATSRIAAAATAMILGACLLAYIEPAAMTSCRLLYVFGKLLWIAVIARGVTRVGFRILLANICGKRLNTLPGGWNRFLFAPLIFTLMVVVVWYNVVLVIVVTLNYPFLQHAVDDPSSLGVTQRWVGFMHAGQIQYTGYGYAFYCGSGRLAYDASYPAASAQFYGINTLVGGWYYIPTTEHESIYAPRQPIERLFSLVGDPG